MYVFGKVLGNSVLDIGQLEDLIDVWTKLRIVSQKSLDQVV
jgi:hypothetical protein